MAVSELIRPYFNQLAPLIINREELDSYLNLDAEESPFSDSGSSQINKNPDFIHQDTVAKIAKLKNLKPENIYLANGRDEIIDLLVRVTCEPGKDNLLTFPPSEPIHQRFAVDMGVYVQLSPLDDDYQIDLDTAFTAINSATKLMLLSNPNTITGGVMEREFIYQIIKGFPHKMILIDESMIDFSGEKSFIDELETFPNVVVMQTFSNSWGLAGLNIAVAYGHPIIIRTLNKIRYSYNLNRPTLQLLDTALDNSQVVKQNVLAIQSEREYLADEIGKLKITEKLFHSDANIILVRFKKPDQLFSFLKENKILVWDLSKSVYTRNCLRISVGNREQNQTLLACLKKFDEDTFIQ